MTKPPLTITLAGRTLPIAPIEQYLRFLRTPFSKVARDGGNWEWERSQLHNAIFHAAGLEDKDGTRARVIGYGAHYSPSEEEKPYGEFDDALEDILCDALACPDCGSTLSIDANCQNGRCKSFGKHFAGTDAALNLRRIVREQKQQRGS